MTERWHPDESLPVVARFEVRRRAYLALDGSIKRQLPAFASDTRLLVRLYRAMVLVRAFDVKAMPSGYLVDRKGVVRKVHRGFTDETAATLDREIEALLKEPS